MSRIGEDYIRLAKPARKKPTLRWVGFGLAIPLVMGAVSLASWGTSGPDSSQSDQLVSPADLQQVRASANKMTMPAAAHKTVVVAVTPAKTAPEPARSPKHTDTASTAKTSTAEAPHPGWQKITIDSGETLSLAFEKLGMSYRDSLAVAHLPKYGSRFTRGLKSGDSFTVKADNKGRLVALNFPLSKIRTLEIRRSGDKFTTTVAQATVEHRTAYAIGTISSSFYVDALESGMSDRVIMNLAHIFGWDIDFANDIRAGDRFIVVYDQIYKDGEKIRDGNILAAEFMNRGRDLKAFRYVKGSSDAAYYNSQGRVMKKPFLRVPLDTFRVSSSFSLGRRHPILNTIRRHEGTDYAAPMGTPIHAAGDGRIIFRGRKGGYGNMIAIRHNSRITTRYGHMSRFRSGMGVGTHVKQGQVIGYVGMTGLATGPHVHFEFRVNGQAKNPQTVAMPKPEPLPRKYMVDFEHKTAPLLAQIKALDGTQVASNSTP